MNRLHRYATFLGMALCCVAPAGDFYADRPAPQTVERVDGIAPTAIIDRRLLDSIGRFVLEMRLFYPQKRRLYLGRDAESAYDIDWWLWKYRDGAEASGVPEPMLLNVSRKSAVHPALYDYLFARGIPMLPKGSAVFADTGYEGSVIQAINRALEARRSPSIRGHLISSAYRKAPSSRLSTQAYLPADWRPATLGPGHKEEFLDRTDEHVKAFEGVPHYTSTCTEFRRHPQSGRWDAYAPADSDPAVRAQSLALQVQVVDAIQHDEAWASLWRDAERNLAPYFAGLETAPPSVEATLAAYGEAERLGLDFLWWDLREAFAKKLFRVPESHLRAVWAALPIGLPQLFDLTPEQTAEVTDYERRRYVGPPAAYRPQTLAVPPRPVAATVSTAPTVAAAGPTLLIEDLLQFHAVQKVERRRWEAVLAEEKARIGRDGIVLDRATQRLGPLIGEGTRGDVHALGDNFVVKFAAEGDDARYLAVEYRVESYLRAHLADYGIRTIPTIEAGPGGVYLVRPRIPEELLGANVVRRNPTLDPAQLAGLRNLWERTSRFARETGVGLDTKFDNVAWVDGEWILVDVGPRKSFGPYAMTLDLPTFEDFFRLWSVDQPRPQGLSIQTVVARRKRELCATSLATEGAPSGQ